MPHITKRVIDAAKPKSARFKIWDDEIRGFGVLVLPSGIKSFFVQYRNAHGRSRRLTLGRYGTLTADQARTKARSILTDVSEGRDPLVEKQSRRSCPTIADLMNKYLQEHVQIHNSKRTQEEVERIVRKHIRPHLWNLKVAEVTRADIAKCHHAMAATPRQANFTLSVLSKAFSLAELWGMRPENSNPVRGIKRYSENERERFLTGDELARLGTFLEEAEKIGLPWILTSPTSKHLPKNIDQRRTPGNPAAIAAIRLLLLTGARLTEIISLKWEHIDLQAGTIALPSRKGGGRKAHPVNAATLSIIGQLPKTLGSEWLLPRESDPQRHLSKEVLESTWQKVRYHAKLEDVRLHDLRHTVGTFASQAGGNAFLISHLLRHRNITITNRYVNTDADPIREISEVIGQRIEAGLRGEDSAEVISLKK